MHTSCGTQREQDEHGEYVGLPPSTINSAVKAGIGYHLTLAPDPPFCLREPPLPSPLKRSRGATAGLQGLSQGNHGHLLVEGQTWGRVSATFTNHRPGNPGFYQGEVSAAPCFVEKG